MRPEVIQHEPAAVREQLPGLQEQWLDSVSGVHQHDPGAGADAADADLAAT